MDLEELLRTAWATVRAADLPEHLHEVAFQEAVAFLQATGTRDVGGSGRGHSGSQGEAAHTPRPHTPDNGVGSDEFFSRLAIETGVAEEDLREVLELVEENGSPVVRILQPARRLGTSKAQQARTVVAVVAGARRAGLSEDPVSAKAVREECSRKGCFDGNFSANIEALTGYTYPDRERLMLSGTKWIPEFAAAITRVGGSATSESAG